MPSYTNPATIVVGANEDANQLRSNFDALQAALNGNLDEVNVPNLAAAFTTYKEMTRAQTLIPTQGAGGTFLSSTFGNIAATGAAGSASFAFSLDPADFAANARTTKLRMRSTLITNAVASATNFNAELRPVGTFGGASGTTPAIATVGATTITNNYTTPAANASLPLTSADVNFPAAGVYVFTVTIGAAMAAGSTVVILYELLMRQI